MSNVCSATMAWSKSKVRDEGLLPPQSMKITWRKVPGHARITCTRRHSRTLIKSSPPEQNGRNFADDIFKHIFLNENVRISIKISHKFAHKGPIDSKSALIQETAWRRTGDKPLPGPVPIQFTDAYLRH